MRTPASDPSANPTGETAAAQAFDPDEPTPAVGSWPSLDPRRLGLPALAWLFIAGAVLVGWRSIGAYAGIPLDMQLAVTAVVGTVGAVLPVLVPAALLRRAPDAPRRTPFLFSGLTLGALSPVIATTGFLWVPEPGTALATAQSALYQALPPASALLVGIGLLRLRRGRIDRLPLLVILALVYLALGVAPLAVAASQPSVYVDASAIVGSMLWPLAAAFAVWVPVAAWLGREAPRAFWSLLAATLPCELVAGAMSLLGALAFAGPPPGGTFLLVTASALAAAIASILALVAYGGFVPLDARPGRPASHAS